MSPADAVLVAGAGFLAGAINAVAGGGSLVSFPALLAIGLPPVTANVTNAVAVVPGYLGGSYAYRQELAGQGSRIRLLGAVSVAGTVAGAVLLLSTSEAVFRQLVPFLILASCALLALQPALARLIGRGGERVGGGLLVLQFLATIYGGYFGAGVGIMMLALLGLCIRDDLHRLNALKAVLSAIVGLTSTACFALFADVDWAVAGLMAVASVVGGHVGVSLARRLNASALRVVVVGYGVVVGLLLLR